MNKKDSLVESVLLVNIIKGDKKAFSAIFTAYYRDLVMFAISFTHDPDTAEEIVQDTFVKFWEEHDTLQITISVKSYLLRSVQNRCIDWYRHKRVIQTHFDTITATAKLYENDTDNYLLRSELEDQIQKALALIPPDCSQAFLMNREEGLKYKQIAKKLNVSVRTIEVRISKALHFLRENLKDYLP